jgi:hypothetical protein
MPRQLIYVERNWRPNSKYASLQKNPNVAFCCISCIILFHWQKNRQSCFLQFLCLVKIAFLQNIFFFCFKYLKLKCCPNVTLKTISNPLEILWHTSFKYLTAKKYFFTIGNKWNNSVLELSLECKKMDSLTLLLTVHFLIQVALCWTNSRNELFLHFSNLDWEIGLS